MPLSDLSAQQLAEVDRLCMEFESSLQQLLAAADAPLPPDAPAVVELRSAVLGRYQGGASEELQHELAAVAEELCRSAASDRGLLDGGVASTAVGLCSESASTDRTQRGEAWLQPGAQIGPYLIDRQIGRGGMGEVYRGRDTRLERDVAIKVLIEEIDTRQDPHRHFERFHRETKAVAALSHPSIVSLYDVGKHRGRPYAVMELLEGETLRHRLRRAGSLPASEVRRIGYEAAGALETAHAAGVIHRDLKPENLFLTEDGRVKLLDFGLSRHARGGEAGESTVTGVILGTIGYLSPEQASGGTVEPSSDLFSLGCVLHESLYGERPFGGETIPESLAAIINSQPQVDPQRAAADRQLSETIARCLEKEPQRRFASAAELAQQLARPDQASAAVPLEHAGKPGTALSRRGWIAGAAGVTAVAAGVVLAGNVRRWFALPPRIESVAVLPLNSPDVSPAGTEPTATQDEGGGSLRTRHLHKGEELSAAIADQMTRIADLQVYPFLPLRQHDLAGAPGALGAPGGSPPSAEPAARSERTPDDYRQLANELGVDALLVGSVSTDAEGFDTVSVQLLSARGFQIGRYRVRKAAAENLIGQRDLAQQIAEEIGREIDAYHSGDQRSNESYHCLVNGYARMDPDSIAALSDALACYRSAVRQDQKFPEAYAGIALTSMILLEQADAERRSDLVEAARDAIERVEALGSDLPSAELAAAMLAWQVDLEMGRAERLFAQCMPRMRQSWVANYEYGVFLAAQGRWIEAMDRFRTAQRIDPMSVSFKLEAARTMWLRGEPQRALAQIDAVKAAFTGTAREAAIGLELDILEDTRRMQQARRLLAATLDREIADRDYWDVRAGSLQRLPYGPYGDQLNAAIVQLRRAAQAPGPASEQEPFLLRLRAAQGARLSYLTSIHPAFAMVRQLSSMRDLIVRPSLPM